MLYDTEENSDGSLDMEKNKSINDDSFEKNYSEASNGENQFRILFEESPEAIFVEDENGTVLDANSQACKLHGMTRKELIGINFIELIIEEDIARVKRDFDKWIQGKVKYFKGYSKGKNGEKVPVEIKTGLINYFGKKALLLIVRDITEQVETEKALRINEKKYRTLFEMANDSIFLMKDDLFIDCNWKTLELFECTREEIVGQSPYKFSPPTQYDGRDSREKALEKITAVLKGKPQFFLWKHSKLSGETFDAEVSLNRITLDNEKYIMAIVRNISEKYHNEQLLKKRNDILETIGFMAESLLIAEDFEKSIRDNLAKLGKAIKTSRCYIFQNTKDENGNLMMTLKFLWDSNKEEKLSGNVKKLTVPYAALSDELVSTLASNRSFYGNVRELLPKTRAVFQKRGMLSVAFVPIFIGDKWWGFIGFDDCYQEREWDFSEIESLKVGAGIIGAMMMRKEFEKKIINSLNEKNILIREIHHRVKNNLQIISSLLNLQSKYIDDDEILTIFSESQNRIKSMALIHEKLYHSNDFSKVDFSSYIKTIARQLVSSINPKVAVNIKCDDISMTIEQAIPCGLIINELITNSLKYAFPNNRYGKILITIEETNSEYILVIEDNGIGFPQKINFRTTETLGMQLVVILTEQLSGKIEMKINNGTIFTISIPKRKKD